MVVRALGKFFIKTILAELHFFYYQFLYYEQRKNTQLSFHYFSYCRWIPSIYNDAYNNCRSIQHGEFDFTGHHYWSSDFWFNKGISETFKVNLQQIQGFK